ncbi:spore germination protein [Peptococcaceae bacterium 1198_IL3148]
MKNIFTGTVIRWLRLAAMLISLTLPATYVAMVTYHQGMIPTLLALSISSGREGVPLPAIMEALLMEITFELFREAGIRLPRAVGQAVSIVGALIIGEAAVQAGLVSPIMIIIVATTGIASFAIPAYNLSITLRLLRFPIIILAGLFGFPGLFSGLAFILAHMASLKSFGIPYLTGANFFGQHGRDNLVRAPHWAQLLRPRSIGRMAPIRQKKRQRS